MGFFSFKKGRPNIQSIKAATFKEVIADKNVQLVDVRTPEEFRQGTIANAKLINLYDPNFSVLIDKRLHITRPVAVFCRSGHRSMIAAKMLEKKGFSKIYNLRGGIISWRE